MNTQTAIQAEEAQKTIPIWHLAPHAVFLLAVFALLVYLLSNYFTERARKQQFEAETACMESVLKDPRNAKSLTNADMRFFTFSGISPSHAQSSESMQIHPELLACTTTTKK